MDDHNWDVSAKNRGGSRTKGTRVDRAELSGNDILSPEHMARSRERLRKKVHMEDEK